jgi:arylsulfatase A-like enzyme
MVSAYDFMPTLLDYVNLPLPSTHLPGRSFLPALKDERATGRDAVVIFDEYGYCRMIRTTDWKYIHRYPDGPNELYDLVNDADERQNLVDDPAQAHRIEDLRGQMEAWFDNYVIADRDGVACDVGAGQTRPIGTKWEDGTEPFVFAAIRGRNQQR